MTPWSPQLFRSSAPKDVSKEVIDNAIVAADAIFHVNPNLPPLFSLRHIAFQADVDYKFLRSIVTRSDAKSYRVFRLSKRPAYNGEKRWRIIAIPSPMLMQVQRWITQRILAEVKPNPASTAYSKQSKLVDAVRPHCECRWLIKLDVQSFFESINEIAAYRVFRSLGYQKLVSFELARICTRLGYPTRYRQRPKWLLKRVRDKITRYDWARMGHLPQGAPTSPMLANLAVRRFDEMVTVIADNWGMIYTRYADDLTLSTKDNTFGKERCRQVIGEVYKSMAECGLSPNVSKAKVLPPGSRKVVLGLLVGGRQPRLTREFRVQMRQDIYYLSKPNGPIQHAEERGFSSISGMKNHLFGLASFARQIDPAYGEKCLVALRKVAWPV